MTIALAIVRSGSKWLGKATSLITGPLHFENTSGTLTVSQTGNGSAPQAIPTGIIITPGSTPVGSWSATSAPAAQGNSGDFGYSDNAIARWDCVPYQMFTGEFNVGVVAFHNSGIAKVSFSVNNGDWADVLSASANPQTVNTSGVGLSTDRTGKGVYSGGIVEWWAKILASQLSDIPIEVRAIVYPNTGVPVVLSGMFLVANAGGTLSKTPVYVDSVNGHDGSPGDGSSANPYQTIRKGIQSQGSGDADNLIVYCKAGSTYTVEDTQFPHPNLTNGLITVMPAPGVALSDVVITGKTGGSSVMRARMNWKNITFAPATDSDLNAMFNGVSDSSAWLDGCNLVGPNINTPGNWEAIKMYVTNCSISNCKEGIVGDLVRNVSVDNVGQGGGQASGNVLLANYSITNLKSTHNTTTKAITAGTRSGTTCTVTCTGHGLATGNWVRIEGCTPSGYNVLPDDGTTPNQGSVTVIDANTFSYSVPADPGGSITVGGTVQRENVFHAHTFQNFSAPMNTTILYGVYSLAGGDNGGGAGYIAGTGAQTDTAIIKCVINNQLTSNVAQAFAPKSNMTNFYVLDSSFTGGCEWRNDLAEAGTYATDVVLESTDFNGQNRPLNGLTNDLTPVTGVTVR